MPLTYKLGTETVAEWSPHEYILNKRQSKLSYGHLIDSLSSSSSSSLHHSIIQSFQHSIVPSFYCSIVPLFHHSIIQSFHRSIVPSVHRSIVPLVNHSIIHHPSSIIHIMPTSKARLDQPEFPNLKLQCDIWEVTIVILL